MSLSVIKSVWVCVTTLHKKKRQLRKSSSRIGVLGSLKDASVQTPPKKTCLMVSSVMEKPCFCCDLSSKNWSSKPPTNEARHQSKGFHCENLTSPTEPRIDLDVSFCFWDSPKNDSLSSLPLLLVIFPSLRLHHVIYSNSPPSSQLGIPESAKTQWYCRWFRNSAEIGPAKLRLVL